MAVSGLCFFLLLSIEFTSLNTIECSGGSRFCENKNRFDMSIRTMRSCLFIALHSYKGDMTARADLFLVNHAGSLCVGTNTKVGQGGTSGQQAGLLPESLIWSYIVQLSSALRTIHSHRLACRVMDPTKILLTDKSRLVCST